MTDDNLVIPDFLDRKKNGIKPGQRQGNHLRHADFAQSSWARLEERRKEKARGRVAKMLAIKAEREAVAAGKTWDTKRGGWK